MGQSKSKIRCGPPVALRCSRVTIGSCCSDELVPLRDAVGVILRSVDVDANTPDAKPIGRPIRYSAAPPPCPDLDWIGGRLLERSGAGDRVAVRILVPRGTGILSSVTGKIGKP